MEGGKKTAVNVYLYIKIEIHTCCASSLVGESTRQSGFFGFFPFRLLITCIIAGMPNANVLPDNTDQLA